MNTNAKFMEEEYIMNHIIRDMNEWTEKTKFPSIQDNVVPVNPQPLILDTDTPNMPRHSRRVIRPPVKLTLMGESSLTILGSHEDNPTGYYEAIDDKNLFLERRCGLLWIYPKVLNPLVVNRCTRERNE